MLEDKEQTHTVHSFNCPFLPANRSLLIDKGQAGDETGIENKRVVCVVKIERNRQLRVAVLLITMILSRVRKILLSAIIIIIIIIIIKIIFACLQCSNPHISFIWLFIFKSVVLFLSCFEWFRTMHTCECKNVWLRAKTVQNIILDRHSRWRWILQTTFFFFQPIFEKTTTFQPGNSGHPQVNKVTSRHSTAILQCIRLMARVAVIEIPHPR